MTEVERIANEAVRNGMTYGQYVTKMEGQKPTKKKKKSKKEIPDEIIKTDANVSDPVVIHGNLKNGITKELWNEWKEVRRLFGR